MGRYHAVMQFNSHVEEERQMESIRKALGLVVLGVMLTLAAAPALAQVSTTSVPPATNGVSPIDGSDREQEGSGNR